MSTPYFDRGRTNVLLLPAVASIASPTLAEIAAGLDITPSLTGTGLSPQVTTEMLDRTKWRGQQRVEAPTHATLDFRIEGYRYEDTADDFLWDACVFRAATFMLVRRGYLYTQPFAAAQRVEVYGVLIGKRGHRGAGATTFSCPLFVQAHDDDAAVA